MPPAPLYEYAVEFFLPGTSALPAGQAHALAASFGRALHQPVAGVRVVRTTVSGNAVRCVCVAT
ncbi:MAG TPA: hypothetical protein VFX49_11455, partial [Chloroflexota bacterium]|nr:hypothetical protein [Chloroflexota bacterium]